MFDDRIAVFYRNNTYRKKNAVPFARIPDSPGNGWREMLMTPHDFAQTYGTVAELFHQKRRAGSMFHWRAVDRQTGQVVEEYLEG